MWLAKRGKQWRKHLPKAQPQLHGIHFCLVLALESMPNPSPDRLHMAPASPDLAKATAAALPAQDLEE